VLVERHGVDPARSLFVDDTQRHLDAASGMGFATERFTDAAALRERLVRERLLPG
jgi:2-haloacid dehalogenase